jgi:hypothetical protein
MTKGLTKGFYAGALPNLTRLITRNSYKYPLLIGLPDFYKSHLPQKIHDASVLKFFTGFSIALIESLITCPIERTKVYFMTKNNSYSIKENRPKVIVNSYYEFYQHI